MRGLVWLSIAAIVMMSSCQAGSAKRKVAKVDIKVTSSAFEEGETIPVKYTCDGEEVSPPLKWEGIPRGTKEIALIADDPDAPVGTWVHWVMWKIPADSTGLEENTPRDNTLKNGAKQGANSSRKIGYQGPCPPSGTHRYYFKVYALDSPIDMDAGATKEQLEKAMQGHILAQGKLMGRYSRG